MMTPEIISVTLITDGFYYVCIVLLIPVIRMNPLSQVTVDNKGVTSAVVLRVAGCSGSP